MLWRVSDQLASTPHYTQSVWLACFEHHAQPDSNTVAALRVHPVLWPPPISKTAPVGVSNFSRHRVPRFKQRTALARLLLLTSKLPVQFVFTYLRRWQLEPLPSMATCNSRPSRAEQRNCHCRFDRLFEISVSLLKTYGSPSCQSTTFRKVIPRGMS